MVKLAVPRGTTSSGKTEIHQPALSQTEPTITPFTHLVTAYRHAHLREGLPELVVDIEDTIARQKQDTLAVLNRRYGVDVSIEEAISFKVQETYARKYPDLPPIERPEIIRIHQELWVKGPQLTDPRIPRIIESLRRGWNISLVTATVADQMLVMERLGAKGVRWDHFEIVGSSSEKVQRRPQAFGAMDDHDQVAMSFADMGRVGMVLDAPWNKGAEKKSAGRIVRVADWQEAHDMIMDEMLPEAKAALRA